MARKRSLVPLQVRIAPADVAALRKWAKNDQVSVAAVIRDMTRREHIRRDWAERDNMIEVENAAAERGVA